MHIAIYVQFPFVLFFFFFIFSFPWFTILWSNCILSKDEIEMHSAFSTLFAIQLVKISMENKNVNHSVFPVCQWWVKLQTECLTQYKTNRTENIKIRHISRFNIMIDKNWTTPVYFDLFYIIYDHTKAKCLQLMIYGSHDTNQMLTRLEKNLKK